MGKCSEVKQLKQIYQKYHFKINVSNSEFLAPNKEYRKVDFALNGTNFSLFVDDEYDDFKYKNPLLDLCLLLRELDYYSDSYDYLLWCKELGLKPEQSQVLDYFRDLGRIYREVEKIIGKIDPIINDFDFQMNAGAAYELRNPSS